MMAPPVTLEPLDDAARSVRLGSARSRFLKSVIGEGDVQLKKSRGQQQDFIDSIKSRKEAVSPIGDSVRSDIISHLCNIAVRTGRKITWDSKKEVIVNDAEAAKLTHVPLREPWTL